MPVFLARMVMPRSRSCGVRVHDQIGNLLIGAEDVAVAQHRVNEARLTVVDVRDDGDVAEMGLG